MAKAKALVCMTPGCSNTLFVRTDSKAKSFYCKECKSKYPITLLKLQTEHNLLVPDLFIKISDDYNFSSGQTMAFIFGVTRQVLIGWLKEYLGVTSWVEFKKIYYCKSKTCFIADMSTFEVTKNPHYLIKKLKKEHNICSCRYKLFKSEQPKGRIRLNDTEVSNKDQILIRITGPETFETLGKVSLEKPDKDEK